MHLELCQILKAAKHDEPMMVISLSAAGITYHTSQGQQVSITFLKEFFFCSSQTTRLLTVFGKQYFHCLDQAQAGQIHIRRCFRGWADKDGFRTCPLAGFYIHAPVTDHI